MTRIVARLLAWWRREPRTDPGMRCDHRGIGLPGCVTCDPSAWRELASIPDPIQRDPRPDDVAAGRTP